MIYNNLFTMYNIRKSIYNVNSKRHIRIHVLHAWITYMLIPYTNIYPYMNIYVHVCFHVHISVCICHLHSCIHIHITEPVYIYIQ